MKSKKARNPTIAKPVTHIEGIIGEADLIPREVAALPMTRPGGYVFVHMRHQKDGPLVCELVRRSRIVDIDLAKHGARVVRI